MKCSCGNEADFEKVFFEEAEMSNSTEFKYRTGRYRKSCSHIVCLVCGKNQCVDDSFDGPWYRKTE